LEQQDTGFKGIYLRRSATDKAPAFDTAVHAIAGVLQMYLRPDEHLRGYSDFFSRAESLLRDAAWEYRSEDAPTPLSDLAKWVSSNAPPKEPPASYHDAILASGMHECASDCPPYAMSGDEAERVAKRLATYVGSGSFLPSPSGASELLDEAEYAGLACAEDIASAAQSLQDALDKWLAEAPPVIPERPRDPLELL